MSPSCDGARKGYPSGFSEDLTRHRRPAVYADLDVLVVPSLWLENSPLVIHEAFQAGVPVIGARIGGITELIADGRNGRLYDAESAGELTALLQSVIDDPERLAAWAAHLPPVKGIADDALEWEQVYAGLATSAHEPAATPQ